MIQEFDHNKGGRNYEHARQTIVRDDGVQTVYLIVPEAFEHLLEVWESIWINEIIQVLLMITHKNQEAYDNYN